MAIAQKISPLQISAPTSWAGLTTENHLYSIYQASPNLVSDIVTEVFGQMKYVGLGSFLNKYPTVMQETDAEFQWMLKGDDRKAIPIVSYSAADTARPGLNKSQFEITLSERYFEKSDFLIFDDRDYGVRIMADGVPDGVNFTYLVQHMEPSDAHFIPPGLLTAGRKVSKQNNYITNTLNNEYGGVQFNSPFKMSNEFSHISQKYVVPGNMHDRPLLISMKAPSGEVTKVWTRYQELKADFAFQEEEYNVLMFGRLSRNDNGTFSTKASNGFPIKTGAGLRQQIAPSHRFTYTTFSLDYLLEVAEAMSINILPEDQRKFLILTGERGMKMFSDAVADKVAVFQPLGDERRLSVGSGINNLGFGGQYRQYLAYNGIEYTIMHLPQYDNRVDNRLEHPDGGYMENYRMTIMNIGTSEGEANIQKYGVKNRTNIKWYRPGSTSPFGPQYNGLGASDVDGYDMFKQTVTGLRMKNPLQAAELLPAVTTQY